MKQKKQVMYYPTHANERSLIKGKRYLAYIESYYYIDSMSHNIHLYHYIIYNINNGLNNKAD